MPVTEIALLSYKPHPKSETAIVRSNLEHAARSQATWSKHAVALLECHEDAQLVYLVGGWDSVDQHMTEWIPGPVNQDLLKLLGDDIDVKWMFHIQCEPSEVVNRVVERTRASGGGVVAIGRHFVKQGQKDDFQQTWEENVKELDGFIDNNDRGEEKRQDGWRIDMGYDSDLSQNDVTVEPPTEFVLFTAWPNVQKHLDFAQTEAFKKYGKIRDCITGAEIRHGTAFYVAEP